MRSRFVVLSDTHFFAPGAGVADKTYWNRVLNRSSPQIGAAVIEAINRLAPDFVIHCGDFTGFCGEENWRFGCELMDRLDCPWYLVPGNHDTWFAGVREEISARYRQPKGQCHYSLAVQGIQFLFLDLAWWEARDGSTAPYLDKELYDSGQIVGLAPAPGHAAWLEAELAAAKAAGRSVALVGHPPLGFRASYPVATMPKGEPAAGPQTSLVDYMGDLAGRAELRSVIGRHPQVRIAFAGHWHICDRMLEAGVSFCQTAALREYPFEWRLAEVRDGIMHVSTVGLPDASYRKRSHIPEWRNDWVAGSPSDREFAIELRSPES